MKETWAYHVSWLLVGKNHRVDSFRRAVSQIHIIHCNNFRKNSLKVV